ncbi:MAG: tol-pal system-associated acyl-CoA thioesterase [Rhodospirillaceae bacterium]|nr:tol-pal system-associated acyl-CoA thioesterase [Rhodospirillaceae bacterium]
MTETAKTDALAEHIYSVRVYYEDTDAGGVVYHSNYLRFAERARTELLRDFGIDHKSLLDNDGLMFAVRRCEAEYVLPAHLDDALQVRTRCIQSKPASFWLEQIVERAGETLVEMKVRLVCMKPNGRPARIPDCVCSLLGRVAAITQH